MPSKKKDSKLREPKNLGELLESIRRYFESVRKNDRVVIIHHDDSDGNTSAALFSILIHRLTGEYPVLFPVSGIENVDRRLVDSIKRIGPNHVFVLDVAVEPKMLDSLKGFILDHHVFSEGLEKDEMVYFNPRSFEEDDEKIPPVSYMAYKLLKSFFPEEKVAWIAGIGITEDHRVDLCKDVFEKVKEENPELLKVEDINQKNVEKSFFGELEDMVRSGRMLKGVEGARTAVLALVECNDRPDKFVNGLTQHSMALRKFYERLVYEMHDCLRDVEKRGRFHVEKKVIIYRQRRKKIRGMTSYLADKIRQKYPKWIAYVINEDYGKGKAKISIRLEQKERKEDLVEILEKIKEKIPSVKGGGHKSAIGVILSLNDVTEFEEEFLNSIE